ncbi:DUF3177 family protein [Prochlorococcus sp. AH-716-D22]|nr:DUF3177 family protein [Prochlorococcus sp. AH-716-D22]
MNSLNQLSIWLSFQLSIIFIVGLPLTLFFWSIKNKSKAITKLLSNYWKISILFFISLILLIGEFNYALLITNISTLIMTISVWFWNDINDELNEYRLTHALTTTTKVWRWSITFISLSFLIQSLNNINCISFINSEECEIWLKPSTNFYLILKNLFNFFFGASFSQPVAKFLGLFALLIYTLGLLQWAIIKLPKSGRNSGFSNYGKE